MQPINCRRRSILKGTAIALFGSSWPSLGSAQSASRVRTEWKQFRQTAQYGSFLNAIAAMRRNTNANDQASLQYWANAHQTYCPHGLPYFVSWHRGYLYYFEQQLRISSGDPSLNLPYWDYYSYATLPVEFTDPSIGNPLYVARSSVNVFNALDLSPFASTVYNFQRGTTNAFEPKIENAPHNGVHDLIGGLMSTMQSPLDPIFFLHHANIDRLTHSWALPDGKGIPFTTYPYSAATSSIYWEGTNVYASNLSIERYKTCDPTWLGYDYSYDKTPNSLPPLAQLAAASNTFLSLSQPLAKYERPPLRNFGKIAGGSRLGSRDSLGGLRDVALDENSITVRIEFSRRDALKIETAISNYFDSQNSEAVAAPASIRLVLDAPSVTVKGGNGGFFFSVFINMPDAITTTEEKLSCYVGNFGPFQIAAASHHGVGKIEFDITEILAAQKMSSYSSLDVSVIRVDGDAAPVGKVIGIPAIRVELSEDGPLAKSAATVRGPNGWYR